MKPIQSMVLAAAALAMVVPALARAPLATQTSSEVGVAVAVTPGDLGRGAKSWPFAVSLNTHMGDLSDDLTKTAVLVDEKGGEHRPLAWEGAKPGGHHRSGTLTFAPLSPRPRAIELRIARPGEVQPRILRWTLDRQ